MTDLTAILKEAALRRGQKATELYVLLMLGLFPLFTGISGYSYLHLKKYLFFLCATCLWLLFLLVSELIRLLRVPPRVHLTLPLACTIAFAALASLSTILSKDAVLFSFVVGKYDSLLSYLFYCCILLGVSAYGADKKRCLWVFAASYTLCCLISVLQLFGLNALWLFPDGLNYYSPFVQETGAFLGPLGNIDLFSGFHCLAIPLLSAAVFSCQSRFRFLLLIPIAMGLACLCLTKVASGILAVLVTGIIFVPAFFALRLPPGSRGTRWVRFCGFLLLAAGAAAVYMIPFHEGTMGEFHRLLHGELLDEFGSHRILIWRKCAAVFREHFLFGIGPDCLENHLDILFERYSEALGQTLYATVDNAHSSYIQLLINFGLAGFIPLSILMADTWNELLRSWSSSRAMRILSLPFFCYLVQAIFNIGTCILVPLFLILWGLILHEARSSGDVGRFLR